MLSRATIGAAPPAPHLLGSSFTPAPQTGKGAHAMHHEMARLFVRLRPSMKFSVIRARKNPRSTAIIASFSQRLRLRINLYRGGQTCRKDYALRHLIDVDLHRNALCQAHPGEDWVDRGEPLPIGLRVRDVDAPGDAADM